MDSSDERPARTIAQTFWDECSEAQQRWIEHVYQIRTEEQKHRCHEYAVKAALDGQIPRDFNTRSLPSPLIVSSGQELTPYGVLAVDPESSIIEDLNMVAGTVRTAIIDAPSQHEVTVNTVTEATGYDEATISLLLSDIGRTSLARPFIQGEGLRHDFDAFYAFDGDIETYLADAFLPDQQAENIPEPVPREQPFVIRPVFQSRIASVIESFCFVLMPFSTDWSSEVYGDIMQPALDKAGYTYMRADESAGQVITEDIWQRICQAELILADLTGQNKNVMYELGIVHTVGKPMVLLSQKDEGQFPELPFDIKHHRLQTYENSASGARDLEDRLPKIIDDVMEEHNRRTSHEARLSNPAQAYAPLASGSILGGR